jgi:RyR domain-containing protein
MRDRPAPYTPEPIDTSTVELNAGVQALTERLAQNAHDQWARRRLAEGWKWGPGRDDHNKEHPCLVPYADLPETE